jgi:hypothetical protein
MNQRHSILSPNDDILMTRSHNCVDRFVQIDGNSLITLVRTVGKVNAPDQPRNGAPRNEKWMVLQRDGGEPTVYDGHFFFALR